MWVPTKEDSAQELVTFWRNMKLAIKYRRLTLKKLSIRIGRKPYKYYFQADAQRASHSYRVLAAYARAVRFTIHDLFDPLFDPHTCDVTYSRRHAPRFICDDVLAPPRFTNNPVAPSTTTRLLESECRDPDSVREDEDQE